MEIREDALYPGIFNFDVGHKLQPGPGIRPKQFRTRQVCAGCNNGWMSHLESQFQRQVGSLVEPDWPHLATEMVQCLRQEPELLIRWMIKMAVVVEKVVPKGN